MGVGMLVGIGVGKISEISFELFFAVGCIFN